MRTLSTHVGENSPSPSTCLNRADKKRVPLVIFVHGGGWIRGSHRGYRPAAIALAKRGFATATVEYRLVGEAMFPAAIYDVKAAIR